MTILALQMHHNAQQSSNNIDYQEVTIIIIEKGA